MSLLRSASVVGAATMLSRVLGMVRDIACASLLGAGLVWDSFVVAWRIPNLFRRLLGEGALSSAFIPVFSGEKERGGEEAAFRFFGSVLTVLTLLLAVLTVLGVALAVFLPPTLFGAGDAAEKARMVLDLLALLFPYVLLVNVMALFMAVLNSLDHFFAPAVAPAVLNAFWIGGVLLAPHLSVRPQVQIRIVALAILVGGVAQVLLQIPYLKARGVPLKPRWDLKSPPLRRMLLLMFPMVLGLAPVQVNLVLDTLIAEVFVPGHGANSHLFFGNRLIQLPLALIGIAFGVVVFPLFARQAKAGRKDELATSLGDALRLTFYLSLPAAAGLVVLANPMIALIYERGRFLIGDTFATGHVLEMYALGLPAYCGLQILTRLFYSLEEVKTPLTVGAVTVLLNLALNLILVGPMREAGLALATSISATVDFAVLAVIARRRLGIGGLGAVARSFVASLLLAGVMAFAVHGLTGYLQGAWPRRALFSKLLWVLPPVVLGGFLHLGGGLLFGFPEARRLLPWIADRMRR